MISFLKHIIWNLFQFHRKGDKPNIFLFTSWRSGGNWLTEVISSGKKIKYIIEPFATGSKDPLLKKEYPDHIHKSTIPLHQVDREWMLEFNDRILSGNLSIKSPWNIFNRQFHFINDIYCLKIHMSKNWILWYRLQFPDDIIIYYLRHPIPQALSSIKRDSKLIIEDWLEDDFVKENYITNEMKSCINKISDSGSTLAKYILNWLLENIAAISEIEKIQDDIFVLTYEEFVVNSDQVTSHINKYSQVGKSDKELAAFSKKPSLTVKGKTKEVLRKSKIRDTDKFRYLLTRWEQILTYNDKREIQELFDCFSFKLYTAFNSIPNSKLFRFPSTSEKFRRQITSKVEFFLLTCVLYVLLKLAVQEHRTNQVIN